MHKQIRVRAVMALAAGLLLAPTLIACSPFALVDLIAGSGRGSELESPAEMENSGLALGVEETLTHIWAGEWELPVGGNVRSACDAGQDADAYRFYGSWFSPEETGFPADRDVAESGMAGLRDWLSAQGWTDLDEFEFHDDVVDVNAFGVEGAKPEAGISWMQAIYYYEGDVGRAYPHVVVDIDSECLVADR